jgi:PAS domain S-box-containing protein
MADREALYSLLFDQMNVAVIATDPDLRITAWNRAAEALYGWKAMEVIGRLALEVVGPLPVEAERAAILERLDRGESVQRPVLQHHRDGRPLVIEGNAVPVHAPDGTLTGYVAVVRDVTHQARLCGELAESDAKYRNLVLLSPDAVLIHQNGKIVFANPMAASLIGAAEPDDLVGRPVLEIVHPTTRRNVERNIAADLRGEESPVTTVEIVRIDGTTVTVQGRGARIPLGGRPAVQVVLRGVPE